MNHHECCNECAISGIIKLHSLVALDDKVITLPWTCENCTVSVICNTCKRRKKFMKLSDGFFGTDDASILKEKIELQDTDDKEQTDVESDDSSDDEDEADNDVITGDVAWGMCSRMW